MTVPLGMPAAGLGRHVGMFLGVDGGGTGTARCLLDESVRAICERAQIKPADLRSAFLWLPGCGEASGDLAALDAAPRSVLGHDRYRCDNDMVCGWAGSLGGADGINVISGIGSMTYGMRAGRGVRAGGWSELFGDERSACSIAVRGLSAFSRMRRLRGGNRRRGGGGARTPGGHHPPPAGFPAGRTDSGVVVRRNLRRQPAPGGFRPRAHRPLRRLRRAPAAFPAGRGRRPSRRSPGRHFPRLLLFKALALGPAFLIFPIVSLSPAVTVLMAVVMLRERLARLAVAGVVLALVAIVLFSVSSGTIVLSLAVYQTLPGVYGVVGIVLALAGSTLMVYSDEKRRESVPDLATAAVSPGDAKTAP